MKGYEVTVTYRLYARTELEATSQVVKHEIEPEAIDVSLAFEEYIPEVQIPDF